MPRTVRNAKIDTRSARTKLPERREPYWTPVSRGCGLGYRRGAKGGTWIARLRTAEGRQIYDALGAADDARDADGLTVFSFAEAQDRARKFFHAKARELAGSEAPDDRPYTVERALAHYFLDREQRGSKGVRADRYAADARIIPLVGDVELSKLTANRIKAWRRTVETAPKLLRTGKAAGERRTVAVDPDDVDAVRSRKATSNRVLTILKAALNHAFAEGKVGADAAWRQVKSHREVDAPLIRFLSPAECVRLVNAADGAFRTLIRGALTTGARYGELGRMRVADFSASNGMITVRLAKGGKPRHIALNDEGRRLFDAITTGRAQRDLVFARDDGEPWGPAHQQRPIAEASRRAAIEPPATFHALRHTYASALAMKGVSMRVIADQLGHADTRVTERHYAHLAPSYVADTVRAALPGFGIFDDSPGGKVSALPVRAAR